ncbi:hypothetical protein PL8927_710001 [Planktothrix serta PCC 8927]|uniref:Uncharacterized protein n=1 Tax=Planktothrix serta PCC 8927 TaxID=671068 RepID=A0A7Z9E358_9CYAN|nr:hypothetical protein PL8927_710001 [Planktothrix serta PCC 8927]
MERGEFLLLLNQKWYLVILIAPPSLAGKGAGGLGHTNFGRT